MKGGIQKEKHIHIPIPHTRLHRIKVKAESTANNNRSRHHLNLKPIIMDHISIGSGRTCHHPNGKLVTIRSVALCFSICGNSRRLEHLAHTWINQTNAQRYTNTTVDKYNGPSLPDFPVEAVSTFARLEFLQARLDTRVIFRKMFSHNRNSLAHEPPAGEQKIKDYSRFISANQGI
jgi:hypothetical protein